MQVARGTVVVEEERSDVIDDLRSIIHRFLDWAVDLRDKLWGR